MECITPTIARSVAWLLKSLFFFHSAQPVTVVEEDADLSLAESEVGTADFMPAPAAAAAYPARLVV